MDESSTDLARREESLPVPRRKRGPLTLLGSLALLGAAAFFGVELYSLAIVAGLLGGLGFIMGLVKPGSHARSAS